MARRNIPRPEPVRRPLAPETLDRATQYRRPHRAEHGRKDDQVSPVYGWQSLPRAVNAWWTRIIARRNSPIIAPEMIAIIRTLRGRHMRLIVSTSDPRHSFAAASMNTELQQATLSSTAKDLCVMQNTNDACTVINEDVHTALCTRRRNGTKVQSAVRSRTTMRPTGLALIPNARIGHATRTAILTSNGEPMAAEGKIQRISLGTDIDISAQSAYSQ